MTARIPGPPHGTGFWPPGMREGTPRQQEAARVLEELHLEEELGGYSPRLVGTVPIGIDVDGSDLDVICEAQDLEAWCRDVTARFHHHAGFRCSGAGRASATANFVHEGWEIELFAQDRPTDEQNGYRHMVVEERILRWLSPAERERIRDWKTQGMKTEPAFARLLGLSGDPYEELLVLWDAPDEEIQERLRWARLAPDRE
ncbi:DUF4269 domain-containing protein [Gorillibacterium sp. CAU 1737]|uniref:DUF4269 domain-containing protein n=1 Tax=Gorillibacterium sp. CAU 1737 TaxID=3140362 RepID=UPI003260DD64